MTKEEKQKIIVKMNFPAPIIKDNEVRKILDNKLLEFDQYWVKWLEGFFDFPKESFTEDLLKRFQEINTEKTFMNIVPSIHKILKPLEDSCKAYSFGLYSASIALSALAAESLQILLWEMQSLELYNTKITPVEEKFILGREFQKLEQSRRIEIIFAFKWINQEQKKLFHDIREVRNSYLHAWKHNFKNEKKDALRCYKNTFQLFREITGVKLKDASSVEANPLLIKWMNNNIDIK